MRLTNISSRPTKELIPLIDFVAQFSKYAYLARLEVIDGNRVACGGIAHHTDPNLVDRFSPTPSLVEIQLAKSNAKYPVLFQLGGRSNLIFPTHHFETWQEDFVAALAHELRHIDQFWTNSHTEDQRVEAELDAEYFAASVLQEFRTQGIKKAKRRA